VNLRPGSFPPIIIAAISLSVAGCGVLDPGGDIQLRVRNGSSVVLDDVVLFLPMETLTFSGLGPSESTPYHEVAKAYRIASVQVVVSQDTARLQVIDLVGEEPLDTGRYTYVLRVFDTEPLGIGLEFQRDS